MTRPFPPALLLALLPRTAQAEDKITLAECTEDGCRCRLTSVTPGDLELLTGAPVPDGAGQMVLVEAGGEFVWSRLSPGEIDFAMGSDGQCDLELFDEIRPRDGTWTPVITAQDYAQCPGGGPTLSAPRSRFPPHRAGWSGADGSTPRR